MKVCFLSICAILTFGLMALPAAAQGSCGGGTCQVMCAGLCLDGMTCTNEDSDDAPMYCYMNLYPACSPYTPILIDAKNQGFHLTNLPSGVKFTFGANLLQTSWTNPDYSNAWLALDRNGNGVIDDASELFGNLTPQPAGPHPNGYKALAVFDDPKNGGNGNGKIDPGDAIWPSLRLWIDRNHNGISEPSELIPLSEAGVFSISLNYSLSEKTDAFGNEFRYVANIQDQYGHQNPVCYDVTLVTAAPGFTTTSAADSQTAKDSDAGTGRQ